MTKDAEELISEVKKLRRRLHALENTEETNRCKKDPSNDPNDEMLEIPH